MSAHDALEQDRRRMREALDCALEAYRLNEVPVGAVLVDAAGEVLARGANSPIAANDPTAHAEIVACGPRPRRSATIACRAAHCT